MGSSTKLLWGAALGTAMAVAAGSYGLARDGGVAVQSAGVRPSTAAVSADFDAPRGRDLSVTTTRVVDAGSDEAAPRGTDVDLVVISSAESGEEAPFAMFIAESASPVVETPAIAQHEPIELSSSGHADSTEVMAAPRGRLCEAC